MPRYSTQSHKPLTLWFGVITRKWSWIDCFKATFYLYIFPLSYSRVWWSHRGECPRVLRGKYPPIMTFTGETSPVHFQSTWLLPLCTYVLLRIYICVYGSVSCLYAVRLLLKPSYMRLPLLSGVLFFEDFLELRGSEFLQHAPVVKSWEVLLLLSWLHRMIRSGNWFYLSVHMYLY